MLPRSVERDEDQIGISAPDRRRGVEARYVDGWRGGGRREEVDGGRRLVEEFGEAWPEAAADDGGGVEEALPEDWCGGELVASLVRMLEDNDFGSGCDWWRR